MEVTYNYAHVTVITSRAGHVQVVLCAPFSGGASDECPFSNFQYLHVLLNRWAHKSLNKPYSLMYL